MPRMTIEDLKQIREQARLNMTVRGGVARAKITVHMGTCGIAAGARDVMAALLKQVETLNLTDVIVTTSSCAGFCSREPMATVEVAGQSPIKYVDLTPEKVLKVLEKHVIGGVIAAEFALGSGCETTG